MNWIVFALGAISAGAVSDLFRKLGSNLRDPFLSNLIFQVGSLSTAILLYMVFSRKIEGNSKGILFALIGGVLISIFTTFSFKALASGPDVSTVIPVIRVGVVLMVVILGILLFKDKITWNLITGVILATIGVFLISMNK